MSYCLSKGCASYVVDDEYCVFSPEGDFATFNETGRLIMEMIGNECGCEEITKKLTELYDLDDDDVDKDTSLFLADLARRGFLDEAPDEP